MFRRGIAAEFDRKNRGECRDKIEIEIY